MKIFILLLLFQILNLVCFAQDDIDYGVKVGLNISNIHGDSDFASHFRTAQKYGIFCSLKMMKKVHLQAEVSYSLKGFTFNEQYSNLDYISVPILCKYKISKKIFIVTGPQLSFLILSDFENPESNLKDNMNSFDFGWQFGLEVYVKYGFSIKAGYDLGLLKISDKLKAKNYSLQIGIAYSIRSFFDVDYSKMVYRY